MAFRSPDRRRVEARAAGLVKSGDERRGAKADWGCGLFVAYT
jgi:hypothetical protein